METNTRENPAVPWIKFRWCLSIPCQTKKVYLILTSITGSEIHLDWKNDLGWFESNILCLPCGFHTGFILIREKVLSLLNQPDSDITERDYQVDPFFISPHKFSVELFLQSSVASGLWKENILRKRYLSLRNIGNELENDHILLKQKSLSCEELHTALKPFNFDLENGDSILNNKKIFSRNTKYNYEKKTKENINKIIDKQCKSLFADNQSFSEEENNFNYPHPERLSEPNKQNKQTSFDSAVYKYDKNKFESNWLQVSNQNYFPEDFRESVLVPSKVFNREESPTEKTSNLISSCNFQKNTYIRQINTPEGNGYDGCLITFESRSNSMNDVGSSWALEEALLSFNSDEKGRKEHLPTDCKDKKSEDTFDIKNNDHISRNSFHPSILSFKREVSQVSSSGSSVCENTSRNFDSDITIQEDENFQYDSLKNDEHKIPINIKELVDSDDSLICSGKALFINSGCFSAEKKETDISVDNQEFLALKVCQLSEYSDYKKNSNVIDSNNLEQNYTNTFMENKITDLFIPVDPGSFRSESEIGALEDSFNKHQFPLKSANMKKICDTGKSFSNSSQAASFVKKENHLQMNSIGTQTSPVTTFMDMDTSNSIGLIKSIPKRLKENYFNPLPDKVKEPVKFRINQEGSLRTPNSDVKKLHKNLHNISKANSILKKMHPFDYRPTLIHKNKTNSLKSEANFHTEKTLSLSTRKPYLNKYMTYRDFDNKTKDSFVKKGSPSVSPSFPKMLTNSSLLMTSDYPYIFAPKREKISRSSKFVSYPMLSVYGKNYSELHRNFSVNKNQKNVAGSPSISSILCQRNIMPSRIAVSDPNLNMEKDQPIFFSKYEKKRRQRSSSNPSLFDQISDSDHIFQNTSFNYMPKKSYEESRFRRDSNGASTDLLLEETMNLCKDLREIKSRDGLSDSCNRRYFIPSEYGGGKAISPKSFLEMNKNKNSLSKILRARSETDLRIIGKIGSGYTTDSPYLPYTKEQLSLGQVVKVLIPGEGVALARIVYKPIYQHYSDENISVVLLSEPQSLLGAVVSIPLDKILLAWPKI